MADRIVWQLGADASQVRAEMDRSVAAVNKGTGAMAGAFDKVDGSQGRVIRSQRGLLESNNRVTNQFQGFSRALLNARSATDVAVAGLDRLENSLNLSLGAGFALAGAAVLIGKIGEIQREYAALNKEIDKLTAPRAAGNFQSLDQLKSHLAKVADQLKELTAIQKDQGISPGQWVKDWFTGGQHGFDVTAPSKRRKEQIGDLSQQQFKTTDSMVDKRRTRSDLKANELAGAPDYATKAAEIQIAHDEANHAVHMMTQAAIELDLAFKELSKTVTDKHRERSSLSLAEMAAIPESVQPGMTYDQLKAGQGARRAMELEQQGEAARRNFQPELAHDLYNQAGAIKDNLTNLKPSEKMAAEFKGALMVTEQELKIIAQNTAKPLTNR